MPPGIPRLHLRHIHLPGLTPYLHASHIQDTLVRAFLNSKVTSPSLSPSAPPPPPLPTILTAEFHPVYTCGRREISTVTPSQITHLRANGRAEFHPALRGGQTTFHGPGQLVAYPILDLRNPSSSPCSRPVVPAITPRCYIRLLESSVIRTCDDHGVPNTTTTENPGVWTKEGRKICAVGVHLRRFVSSHGIGLNVATDMWWFERIVACGLPEKEATSFEREGVRGVSVEEVGESFVRNLARGLVGREGENEEAFEVEKVGREEIQGMLEGV